jgi:hypothetical protein
MEPEVEVTAEEHQQLPNEGVPANEDGDLDAQLMES